jgi:hypothetical protein
MQLTPQMKTPPLPRLRSGGSYEALTSELQSLLKRSESALLGKVGTFVEGKKIPYQMRVEDGPDSTMTPTERQRCSDVLGKYLTKTLTCYKNRDKEGLLKLISDIESLTLDDPVELDGPVGTSSIRSYLA